MQLNPHHACSRFRCEHHPPAYKLQRFGLYLLVGVLVLLSQTYSW